jgi:uncharacterized cofD-like protein
MSPRAKQKSRKKVVVIGGGTGVFTLLTGLKNYFEDISAVVTVADEGGSSGMLREDFGILPPGDIRRALVALSSTDNKTLSELFNYRFTEGRLSEHSFGNLMLTALERITGSFEGAIAEAGEILAVKGSVIPVTLEDVHLEVQLENGSTIRGEHNIDVPKHDGSLKIVKAWLTPEAKANPRAMEAILKADVVVVGPGDIYTSIVPNLLVKGIANALKRTKAEVLYVVNLTTKFGETNGFTARDFLDTIEAYAGKGVVDQVLINNRKPSPRLLKAYMAAKAEWVKGDLEGYKTLKVVRADIVRQKGFLRHDPEKTAKLIYKISGQ